MSILSLCSSYLHKQYLILLGKPLIENAKQYLANLTLTDLRNIKKESFDLIINCIKFYLGIIETPERKTEIVEDISINLSIKLIKTTFLEKRIQAVKKLTDIIRHYKHNKEKMNAIVYF